MWYTFNSPVPVQRGYSVAYIPPAPAGRDCGCGGPRGLMGGPGGIPGGGGSGTLPPGPGPMPPGPGPFPPGPGPLPPGPFPPGPGPGPGPFPPGPFPPGPGPGPGPFPPGPFPPGPGPIPPWPFPIPIPIPIPGPVPVPLVTVVINGGQFFPSVTQAYRVRHYPGMSVYQALAATGVVRFNSNGQIIAVNGITIAGDVAAILSLNGRRISQSLLYLPVQAGDSVGLDLILTGSGTVIPRTISDTQNALPYNLELENNYDLITDDQEER